MEFISTPDLSNPIADSEVRTSPHAGHLGALDHQRPAPRAVACSDPQFLQLLAWYRALGGLTRLQQLQASVDRSVGAPDAAVLADVCVERWWAEHRIFAVEWSNQAWTPQFQIEPLARRPIAAVADVLGVLDDTFDDMEIAVWFATPNVWIAGRRPAATIGLDESAVLNAARTDRFVARG